MFLGIIHEPAHLGAEHRVRRGKFNVDGRLALSDAFSAWSEEWSDVGDIRTVQERARPPGREHDDATPTS